jgi:hypothetical protein
VSLALEHLPEPDRQVYELLADHPGPDTTAAPLAFALDLPEPDVTAALHRLHAARMVERWPGDRYTVADHVRQHATHRRRQAPPSTRTLQVARLIDWYAATAGATVPVIAHDAHRFSADVVYGTAPTAPASARQARVWFSWEHHVLRDVLATAVERHHDDAAVELAEALWHLARPTYHHDDLVHAQHAGYTAALRTQPSIAAVFRARAAAGLTDLGSHDDALDAVTEAIGLARDTGDRRLLIAAHSLSGRVHLAAGHPDAALHELTIALTHHRRVVDDHGHAVLRRRIGQAHLAHGHPGAAVPHLRASSQAMARAGHPLGTARALTVLADAHLAQDRPGPALAAVGQARRLLDDVAGLRYRAGVDLVAAEAAYRLGDTGITRRLTDDLIPLLTHAGPGAASDLAAATDLRDRL